MTEEHDLALLLLEQIADALRRPISEDEEDAVVELIEAAFARESATSRARALSDATTRLLTFEPSARSSDYYPARYALAHNRVEMMRREAEEEASRDR